ncbi:MAG: DUF2332 family protein [Gemmatimonas sp.]|nr:DUF2332 family protein [Gemmatimonas sp.]
MPPARPLSGQTAAIEEEKHSSQSGSALLQPVLTQVILGERRRCVGRTICATILPVLARLPEPLALLEVGAAAGLCLLPDRYGYDYGRVQIQGEGLEACEAPIFPCRANEATPLPSRVPNVVWRGGLDLHPLDVSDPEDVRWLESLVWPGQEGRTERLRAAIRLAQESPPRVSPGDLLTDLPTLMEAVPGDATLVVFHSAVLAYLDPDERGTFWRLVRELNVVWVSNEAPGVFPEIDSLLNATIPRGRFILSVNGLPVAFTGPHGQSIDWIHS